MLLTSSKILQDKGLFRPTVLIDPARARANIQRMVARARAADAVLRPHFKTHQSDTVGRWYRDAGVRQITVSTLDMAEQFAGLHWRDITVAILHNPRENARAKKLAERLAAEGGRLGLLVDNPAVAADLSTQITAPTDVWLKVDTGYCRTGTRWDDRDKLRAVCGECRGQLHVRGLLSHSGHSYNTRGVAAVQAVYDESVKRLQEARAHTGLADLRLSLGDTPCCSLANDLSACDEIRPGNFVFYDLMQLQIGSCRTTDLAAAVICPVIGVYPERRQIVLHGGAAHLSKEFLVGPDGRASHGALGTVTADGLGEVLAQTSLVSLSQEHGVVEFAPESPALFDGLVPGDLVVVWPVHSCLSCNLLREQMVSPHLI